MKYKQKAAVRNEYSGFLKWKVENGKLRALDAEFLMKAPLTLLLYISEGLAEFTHRTEKLPYCFVISVIFRKLPQVVHDPVHPLLPV